MLNNLRGNWLLWGLTAFFTAYVIVGLATPRPYVWRVVGVALTLIGGYMLIAYTGDFFDVLWRKRRGGYGAHLKIVGAWLIGFGFFYTGLWRAAYDGAGTPETWLYSWHSSFGWVSAVVGGWLVGTDTSEFAGGARLPSFFWRASALAIFGALCYAAGAYLQ